MQNSLRSKVQKLKGNSKGDTGLTKTMTLVMREMHISWGELMELPIPSFLIIVDVLNKDAAEQERKMRKK